MINYKFATMFKRMFSTSLSYNIMFKSYLITRKSLKPSIICLLFVIFSIFGKVFAQDGKKLFKANCASCHYTSDAKLVGPGLKGVEQRWPDKAKLYAWIRNSQEFLKTGDPYANKLYLEYNKAQMTAFPDLTDAEIDAILAYIANPDDDKKSTNAAPALDNVATNAPAKDDSNLILYILLGLGVLFLILINVLVSVKRSLQKLLNEREGLGPVIEYGWIESIKIFFKENKVITALTIVVIIVGALNYVWNFLMGIGVYEGYEPEQPIAFSHQVHAGQNGINCQYCHIGVEKSKHAVIPSANICMNCHKAVKEGPRTGTKEIAKIYAALDYNPETGEYGNNPKPIKWIKVHNLPDHVYFSHAQHVKVGGIECKTCHGEVEKMEVVKQYAPLTMGWCINCHRETAVNTQGNGYYEEFHARLTDELKAKFMKDGKLTVEEIGGLECAKCHY
jgi:cytochrome c551/c552